MTLSDFKTETEHQALHPFTRATFAMASSPFAQSFDRKDDSRALYRTACVVPGRLLVAPAEEYACTVVDITEAGIGVRTTGTLPAGAHCMVSFDLVDDGLRRRVNAWGTIVYCTECAGSARAGIRFEDMDSNSRLLLRRFSI